MEVGHPCCMLVRVRLCGILRSHSTAHCSLMDLKFTVYFCPGTGTDGNREESGTESFMQRSVKIYIIQTSEYILEESFDRADTF